MNKVMKHRIDIAKAALMGVALLPLGVCMSAAATAGDTEDLQLLIDHCVQQKETAHQMAECARKLGYDEEHFIIKTAQDKWTELHGLQDEYSTQLTKQNEKLERQRREYPYATEIYEKLKSRGLRDITTYAIMGNIMREVGGDTLSIDPFIGGNGYYGMCQWSLYYNPGVSGEDIDGQLDYLFSTMPQVMKQFGGSYDYFVSMTDAGAAAQYFNTYYERGSGNALRASNAYVALEYYG